MRLRLARPDAPFPHRETRLIALLAMLALSIGLLALTPARASALTRSTTIQKSVYTPGQTVVVTVRWTAPPYWAAVYRPDGGRVAVLRFVRRSSTEWRATYVLPQTAPAGRWRIGVNYLRRSARFYKYFTVQPAAPPPNANPHADLRFAEYPSNCRSCHAKAFSDMYASLHYQWQAPAPDNVNQPGSMQGKATNAINSYCINPLGNWLGCGKCHAGRGDQPVLTQNPSAEQLDNVDCLVCHNTAYGQARVRKADGSMRPNTTDTATLDGFVRNVSRPTRAACLKCHAYAGGGDAYKRGDIAWAHASTTDRNFDVHMATTGANLACQSCHTFVNHKVTGKGSDLQATDHAAEIRCSRCHAAKETLTGHQTAAVNRHVARVACQTCHIPTYARNASDTAASEATEIDRDWRVPASSQVPIHPTTVKANNLTPTYRWWNRKSNTYLLGDAASYDASTGVYLTSRPVGSVDETASKLYPFKFKTATQPMRSTSRTLIALDTAEYMNVAGDSVSAVTKGLLNMGFSASDPYEWVKTGTFQLLNHEVPPAASGALTCTSCHGSNARVNLTRDLGYELKGPVSTVCRQCHGAEDMPSFTKMHDEHVMDEKYDCSFCHKFSRPERGLKRVR